MSASQAPEVAPITVSFPRKRKRNNSSVSLPEGIIAPLSTPAASPKQIQPSLSRLSTPPPQQLRPQESPSQNIVSLPHIPASPVPARSLGSDFSPSGSQSPRTAVARRFSTLDLSKSEVDTELGCALIENLEDAQNNVTNQASLSLDTYSSIEPQPGRPFLDHASSSTSQRPKKRLPPPRGIKSPPPKGCKPMSEHHKAMTTINPAPTAIGITTQNISDTSSSQPTSTITTTSSPSDAPLLTWQDSEITGHLMLDPEDDGYGINGIGFKPTPAMASARSLRRKQQLTAWRTREEREERERRAEKRRQGRALYASRGDDFLGPMPTLNLSAMTESMDKKMVRFAV